MREDLELSLLSCYRQMASPVSTGRTITEQKKWIKRTSWRMRKRILLQVRRLFPSHLCHGFANSFSFLRRGWWLTSRWLYSWTHILILLFELYYPSRGCILIFRQCSFSCSFAEYLICPYNLLPQKIKKETFQVELMWSIIQVSPIGISYKKKCGDTLMC